MKITINAFSAKLGGTVTYITSLLNSLLQIDEEVSYVVYVSKKQNLDLPENNRLKVVRAGRFTDFMWGRIIFEQLILPFSLRKENADLLFSLSEATCFWAPCPVVITLRNIEHYTKIIKGKPIKAKVRSSILRFIAKYSVLKAQKVIFVSRDSANKIGEQLKISSEKIEVIHHGINRSFLKGSISANRRNIPDEPYLLTVGVVYRHKNLLSLVAAFQRLIIAEEFSGRLLIIGKIIDKKYFEDLQEFIRDNNLAEKVLFFNHMPYEQLNEYYENAQAYVYPSLLETFGHPLLEAMLCGVPIAASNIESFTEIAEKAALYFDPNSIDDIATKLKEILSNGIIREQLIIAGKERVKEFTWNRTAEKTIAVCKYAMH